jgi:ERCC4-related helicase
MAVTVRGEQARDDIRPGMIVSLRRRMWRVEEIAGGVLTATPIDDFGARAQQFLLELETPKPGSLPEPSLAALGDHTLQQLFLQAVRLDALHGTAPFMAIQRTAVIPVEYQLVPLVMALRQHTARLLLADTTGLGKTIEAGLVISELLARGRARSVLIITPASLREQWREQMMDLFYLDFEIISTETRKRLERSIPPGADPWLYFDRLIVSIDYAKDIRIRPEILKRQWDIVVVDEAHNAAMPHAQKGRKADMERWEAVDQIAARSSAHMLLLSATPHSGYTDSYCSLLRMLSPDLVRELSGEVSPYRERATHHVCQRTRKDVQQWFAEAGEKFPFAEREPPEETEFPVELHRDYFRALQKMDKILGFISLHAESVGRRQPAEWLRLHLHRRALSSPEALRRSLENRIDKLKSMLTREAEPEAEPDEPLLASLADRGASDVESEDEQDRRADSAVFSIEQRLQLEYFQDLLKDLQGIRPSKDRKLAALRDQVLPALFGKAGGETSARIIVFTRFKDTLFYLERELGRSADYEIVAMHGDLSGAERDRRFEQFAAAKKAILLATDVISEGLNLQTTAYMVIHYDIPWNPNRIEQRTGRVDRFGQRAPKVYVRTLFCAYTTDEDVMHHLVRKLETMRRDLGFAPPFFATEETVLRVLTRRRSRRSEDPEWQLRLFGQGEEEMFFDEEALRRIRSEGFYGQADVRIRDVAQRLREVHQRFGSPDQIRRFIEVGLMRYQCGVEKKANGTLAIQVNHPRLRVAGQPDHYETVVLDPDEKALHPEARVLDVGHPLIRRLNAVIREDALRQSDDGARTAAYVVRDQRGTILLGHGLLRATASTHPPTLLEEIVTFGIRAGLGGVQPLTPEQVTHAAAQLPSARPVQRDQALATLGALYQHPAWSDALRQATSQALETLRQHRARIKAELETSGPSSPDASQSAQADFVASDLDFNPGPARAWLDGFDQVQQVGFDLYCLTLLLPEGM